MHAYSNKPPLHAKCSDTVIDSLCFNRLLNTPVPHGKEAISVKIVSMQRWQLEFHLQCVVKTTPKCGCMSLLRQRISLPAVVRAWLAAARCELLRCPHHFVRLQQMPQTRGCCSICALQPVPGCLLTCSRSRGNQASLPSHGRKS